MDRTAKFFPIQHCVNAVQDNAAQTQPNKPQAATASASPAKPPSSPLEE